VNQELTKVHSDVVVTFSRAALDEVLKALGNHAYEEFHSTQDSFGRPADTPIRMSGLSFVLLPSSHWSRKEAQASRFH
jgi:hypothetical protein